MSQLLDVVYQKWYGNFLHKFKLEIALIKSRVHAYERTQRVGEFYTFTNIVQQEDQKSGIRNKMPKK